MKNGFLITIATLALAACSGGSSNKSDDSSKTSTSSLIFTMANQAFSSTASLSSNSVFVSSKPTNKTGLKSTIGMLVTCDATGRPTSSSQGDANYAAEWTLCALSVNSKSPDTIQGSYFLASAVMCALDKQITFAYHTTPTSHDNISISENDSCFGENGFDSNNDSDTDDTIVLSIRESALSGADYDFLVELEFANSFSDAHIKIWLKNSDNKLGAKIFSILDEAATEIIIDKDQKIVMFENRDYSNERHVRAYVAGDMNVETGAFTSLLNAQFIQAEGSTTSNGESIAYGTNGTDSWYDYYRYTSGTGGQDDDYDICSSSSDCSAFEITYSTNFHDFSGNPSSMYNNADILSLTFPLNMNF